MADNNLITVRGLQKSFNGQEIIHGLDLDVEPGDLTVLIGRSGCGKSTLLRCLNGLEIFDHGKVSIGETHLERKKGGASADRDFQAQARAIRRNFGMVFQSFNLFPHLDVLENVSRAPMVVKGVTQEYAETIGMALLEKVGLASHAHHFPSQLSGGQQQRAAIARALAMAPNVMLYDEPTSALDPWLVDEVFQVMRKLDSEGMTQIVVTHELRFAREVADKIVYMEDGVIIEIGTPAQIFTSPKDDRTRNYLARFLQ